MIARLMQKSVVSEQVSEVENYVRVLGRLYYTYQHLFLWINSSIKV